MNPLDYSLCQQTVTVYQKKGEEISRHVAEKSYFSGSVSTPTEPYGKSKEKKFLLMIPGEEISLQPGDRIFAGIGPADVDWQTFLPVTVSQLYEAGSVRACRWEGRITHWEAGAERRWQ